jgi:alcohol dehydrogenase class IV
MNGVHQLMMPSRIFYGADSFAEVGRQARLLGRKALIVSDPMMDNIGNVETCEEYLNRESLPHARYTGVATEPTDIHVAEGLAVCQAEGCDVIIAVGGGSCIDAAKAVAVMMTNPGRIHDYVGAQNRFPNKPLPLIAIPTTAGTGSEVTKVTVIIDTANDIKMMLSQPELLPTVAIVDPKLSISCPPAVTAATGVDALCHALEAYISRKAQPVTDMLALSAIELIVKNLHRAYTDGDDLEARDKMSLASMLAGAAFSNASVTLVHGMSRPIGALFHVPHGVSNAMLLPAVLEYTREEAVDRLAAIGRLLQPESKAISNEDQAVQTIRMIKQLCRDLHIPNMKQWGIDETRFKQAVSKMAKDAIDSGSPGNNPRVPTHAEIVSLYHICYDYDFRSDAVHPLNLHK